MADFCRAHVLVRGKVQGVGYRAFAGRAAREIGVSGYSRNLEGGDVEIEAEGEREKIEQFIGRLRKGPLLARVENLQIRWTAYRGDYAEFSIRV